MSSDYDVCIIGSGAGAGPVASTLAQHGYRVLVLEKGAWYSEKDFSKDELTCCRRSVFTPNLKDEKHVIEQQENGQWVGEDTQSSGWDFWNGNVVGGSSNFMSGFFYRLKPIDFHLRSSFGPIEGANVVDWPITYDALEPYYTQVESDVGISGKVVPHPNAEPRSVPDFPYPPTAEHGISKVIDKKCKALNFHALPTPRAIISKPKGQRRSCEYSGYCGSYGCSSGAKGSSRAALLDDAVATKQCKIIANAKVYRLESDQKGKVTQAHYYDKEGKSIAVNAKIFVVACHAIESSRLLLASRGPKHANGLANNHQQVGKNLLFSAGGSGTGELHFDEFSALSKKQLKQTGPFVNRGLQDWYQIKDNTLGHIKGGTIDFLFQHPNPINRAESMKWRNSKLLWGKAFKQFLHQEFTEYRGLRFETFCDWMPTDQCFVSLDSAVKDKWGSAVANVRLNAHPHDLKVGHYLDAKALQLLQALGAKYINSSVSELPPANLVAGGCRFGKDIKTSVLNADCQAHDVENLYVTDGSFMPTGGSVPYTWTIYANAFRVADIIVKKLG